MLFTTKPLSTLSSLLLLLQPLTHATPITSPTSVTRRYATGWCGVHVVQYQKNEPPDVNPSPNYALDVIIYDAAQAEIGRVSKVDAPGGQGVDVTSQLPYVLILTTGNVDSDPVAFAYAGQSWTSDDGSHCKFGGYDSGKRQGDCGFTC